MRAHPEESVTTASGIPGAIVALVFGLGCGLASHALPWPRLASTSLATLFVLIALTRVTANLGVAGQSRVRFAVAGIAGTAGLWFGGAALMLQRPALAALAGLHAVAVVLAFGARGWSDSHGRLVAVATGAGLSLVALASLPASAGVPGAPMGPALLAGALFVAAWALARGRRIGLSFAALASAVTFVLATYLFATWQGSSVIAPGSALHLAPLLAATAGLSALVLLWNELRS
jgi:hypothetical protein